MSENQLTQSIESVRDRLNIIHSRISLLPVAQRESELLSQVLEELEIIEAELVAQVSKYEQTEAACLESEELLHQVGGNMRQVLLINSADTREILYINPAYEQIWGRSCESLYQQPQSWLDGIHPEDREVTIATLSKKTPAEPIEIEYRIIRPDGSVGWILARSFPVYNQDGAVVSYVSIAEDISDRKQQETQIQPLAPPLLSLMETVGEGITLSDQRGYFEIFNSQMEEITGYTKAEANQARDFLALMYPDRHDYHQALLGIQQIVAQGGCRNLETIICTKNHRRKTLLVSTSSLKDGDSNWFLSTYRDISDVYDELRLRQNTEAQIKASLTEKEVLLKEIHHRVKNNLQIIASLLRLQANRINNELAHAILEDSRHRVESMALVHDSLYRSGNFSRINFTEYVQNLAANLFRTYNNRTSLISFKVNMEEGIFISLTQCIPCGLILNELIVNALKHGFRYSQTGEVFLNLQRLDHSHVVLIVGNQGDRLPDDFDLHNLKSMGLKLVMTLVNQLKGTLDLEKGEITSFKIKFALSD